VIHQIAKQNPQLFSLHQEDAAEEMAQFQNMPGRRIFSPLLGDFTFWKHSLKDLGNVLITSCNYSEIKQHLTPIELLQQVFDLTTGKMSFL